MLTKIYVIALLSVGALADYSFRCSVGESNNDPNFPFEAEVRKFCTSVNDKVAPGGGDACVRVSQKPSCDRYQTSNCVDSSLGATGYMRKYIKITATTDMSFWVHQIGDGNATMPFRAGPAKDDVFHAPIVVARALNAKYHLNINIPECTESDPDISIWINQNKPFSVDADVQRDLDKKYHGDLQTVLLNAFAQAMLLSNYENLQFATSGGYTWLYNPNGIKDVDVPHLSAYYIVSTKETLAEAAKSVLAEARMANLNPKVSRNARHTPNAKKFTEFATGPVWFVTTDATTVMKSLLTPNQVANSMPYFQNEPAPNEQGCHFPQESYLAPNGTVTNFRKESVTTTISTCTVRMLQSFGLKQK